MGNQVPKPWQRPIRSARDLKEKERKEAYEDLRVYSEATFVLVNNEKVCSFDY